MSVVALHKPSRSAVAKGRGSLLEDDLHYWGVTCEIIVRRGGELDAWDAESIVEDVLQRLINTGQIYGAFMRGVRVADPLDVDAIAVVR